MTGLGMFVMYLSYCGFYWAWNAIQGKDQDSFIYYLFPFFVKNTTVKGSGQNLLTGAGANSTPAPNTPADQKTAVKGNTTAGGASSRPGIQ